MKYWNRKLSKKL